MHGLELSVPSRTSFLVWNITLLYAWQREIESKEIVLRDIFYDFCSIASWSPTKETPHNFPSSSERPADIFLPNYTLGKD
jgi:hypothetical protein